MLPDFGSYENTGPTSLSGSREVGLQSMYYLSLAFFALMLLTRCMLTVNASQNLSLTLFAQAYGTGTYSCGAYQEGCAAESQTAGVPNTGMPAALLSEPSFVVPGSLLLAVLLALITMGVTKLVRRNRTQ